MNDLQLARALRAALERGERAVLCTVVDSRGSVPRGPGARMALLETGEALGTVGGGAVERLAQAHGAQVLATGAGGRETYSLAGGGGTGMVCGGTAVIDFRRLEARDLSGLMQWAALLEAGRPGWLVLPAGGGLTAGEAAPAAGAYGEPLGREGTLYLFGGGHVGQALAPLLAEVGFSVVVFDDRPEMARRERFPGARAVVLGSFDRIGEQVALTPADYAVVMTPGHAGDLAVLRQVLACRPAYVGCMGSRRKWAVLRAALEESGFSPEEIGAVRLPIGLPIGAETPAEIAVSVAAQLIAFRAERRGGGTAGCPA